MNKKKSILESNVLYTIIADHCRLPDWCHLPDDRRYQPGSCLWKAVQQYLQQTKISGVDVGICKLR